jgi:hypothetical protein
MLGGRRRREEKRRESKRRQDKSRLKVEDFFLGAGWGKLQVLEAVDREEWESTPTDPPDPLPGPAGAPAPQGALV